MERLSNIMRGAQGAHLSAHQRLTQQPSTPGQRPPTPGSRSQSERLSGADHPSGLYRSRAALPSRAPAEQDESWEESMQPPARPFNRANYGHGSQNGQSMQRPPHVPHSPRYPEQPQGDYYEEDEQSTIVPADVQEEW